MTPDQAKALREPFPKSMIGKLPKAGIELDYVGHAAVTDRLLQVDPEWTWRPCTREENAGLPQYDNGMWIMLTVAGVTRPGFGDGKNAKEYISDAIRNAAMRFGVALDLWSKQDLDASEEPTPSAARGRASDSLSASAAAPPSRIDGLVERVKTLGLGDWVKAQHFAWPWEDDVCDVIEAECEAKAS